MKKTVFICLIALVSISTYGQNKFDPKTMLKSTTDSVSYSLGHNMTQGLREYLVGIDILSDSAKLTSQYREKIDAAADADKAKIESELTKKLQSLDKENEKSLAEFIKGVESGLTDSKNSGFNIGLGIASQLKGVVKQFSEQMLTEQNKVNQEAFLSGIVGSLKGETPAIPDPTNYLQAKTETLRQEKEIENAAKLKELHGARITEGTKFLAANKAKQGINTTESGLQYRIITQGFGELPKATDRVTVHYEGRLLDGTVFDSSIERGESSTFGVTQVIKGWTEALLLMPAGSKWTVYIPYNLAYGEAEQGPIKPYSTLIFDIELIEIVK